MCVCVWVGVWVGGSENMLKSIGVNLGPENWRLGLQITDPDGTDLTNYMGEAGRDTVTQLVKLLEKVSQHTQKKTTIKFKEDETWMTQMMIFNYSTSSVEHDNVIILCFNAWNKIYFFQCMPGQD